MARPASPLVTDTTRTARLRCDRCGEVIGVYEPVTVVDGGAHRGTSVAAEPALASLPGARYHEACFTAGGEGR